MKFARLTPLAMLCAVSLTACGGSDSNSKTSTTTPPTPPTPTLNTVIIPTVVSTEFPAELKVAADAGFTHYVKSPFLKQTATMHFTLWRLMTV